MVPGEGGEEEEEQEQEQEEQEQEQEEEEQEEEEEGGQLEQVQRECRAAEWPAGSM